MRKLAKHGAAWLVWFAVLWWFWMLLVAEWTQTEIIAASCAALVTATLAEVVRAKGVAPARIPLSWIARARTVPMMIFVDFGVVTWVLLRALVRGRRVEGTFRVKPYEGPAEGPDAAGVRAWVTVAATISPNAYVVDIDAERSLVLLHDLFPLAASQEPA